MELQAEDFHHPYSPYDIQLQFMRALYTCIEKGKVAVFESPTGKLALTLHWALLSDTSGGRHCE
jgi:chromosome transmission fidelity protein 1